MQQIAEALQAFRDVEGVHGSFIITLTGSLIARDLPAAFDNQLFSEVGPRIARLHETFLSGGEQLDACMLRFAEHKLYIRKMATALVGVLSALDINMPALRMVSNLVIRRADPLLADLTGTAIPIVAAIPLGATQSLPVFTTVGGSRTLAARLSPSDAWAIESAPGSRASPRPSVTPEDGRDRVSPPLQQDRHVRMYRGRRVDD
jgi:predicted regulator of Ras-like GTPase activity (Roadblock/LC7/MglB family)